MAAIEGSSSDGYFVRFNDSEAETVAGPVETVKRAVKARLG